MNSSSVTSSNSSRYKRNLSDFEEVEYKNKSALLGKGSYGQVKLVKEKKSGNLYALKIVILEKYHGHPPFKGQSESEKCQNIIKNVQVDCAESISNEAKSLINGILKSEPGKRITMAEIFKHEWMTKFENGIIIFN